MSGPVEADFELAIADWLVDQGGYTGPVKVGTAQAEPRDFGAVRGLDTAEMFASILSKSGAVLISGALQSGDRRVSEPSSPPSGRPRRCSGAPGPWSDHHIECGIGEGERLDRPDADVTDLHLAGSLCSWCIELEADQLGGASTLD